MALVAALTSCVPTTTDEPGPADLVGLTLAEADLLMPVEATYIVQDISVSFGLPPSYNSTQSGSSQWQILAACSDAERLAVSSSVEFAVAPSSSVSSADIEEAKLGGFGDAVTCEERPFRSTPRG